MAYLLRFLNILSILGILITMTSAFGWLNFPYSHIQMAIPAFLFLLFVQAFVMFYFIGASRLTKKVHESLNSTNDLDLLFDSPPEDLNPYKKKVKKFIFDTDLGKRQTIPWTMLMIVLGTIGFLLGGAHDTGLVAKTVHSGVVYGFSAAMFIGFVRQWYYLGKTHILLRKLKALFSLPDNAM